MEKVIEIQDLQQVQALCGNRDENLMYLRQALNVDINIFGGKISIKGEDEIAAKAERVIYLLLDHSKDNKICKSFINFVIDLVDNNSESDFDYFSKPIATTIKGKPIKCKTYGQARYVRAIANNNIVFGVGPAGTGKTYLAVALAVMAYKNKQVEKIILTRPAVEAGEKLGFLPGDLGAKVDPYLRPLYDALQELFGLDAFNRLVENGTIEIAPLAYMRGRTLSNAFIILDEAQNTTQEQMKMFLTRMGEGSKIVVTGDITQIDLPYNKLSGLIHATRILRGIKNIEIIKLQSRDVVRNDLVQAIVEAYDKYNKEKSEREKQGDNQDNGVSSERV